MAVKKIFVMTLALASYSHCLMNFMHSKSKSDLSSYAHHNKISANNKLKQQQNYRIRSRNNLQNNPDNIGLSFKSKRTRLLNGIKNRSTNTNREFYMDLDRSALHAATGRSGRSLSYRTGYQGINSNVELNQQIKQDEITGNNNDYNKNKRRDQTDITDSTNYGTTGIDLYQRVPRHLPTHGMVIYPKQYIRLSNIELPNQQQLPYQFYRRGYQNNRQMSNNNGVNYKRDSGSAHVLGAFG